MQLRVCFFLDVLLSCGYCGVLFVLVPLCGFRCGIRHFVGFAWLWIRVSGFRLGIRCSLRVWYDYSLVFCAIVGYRS